MIKRKTWGILLIVVLVMACALFAACNGQEQGGASSGGEAAAEEPAEGGTIKLAVAGALTGDSAVYGNGLKRAVEFAIAEINAAGGVDGKMFEATYLDDKGDPKEAANVAQKIVSNPDYFAVIGHVNSSCNLAALPIYQDAGITDISAGASNPKITQMGYTVFFRTICNDTQQGPQMAETAVDLGLKKIAVIYANSDYGLGLLEAAKPKITELGGEIVAEETYVPGVDKDFTPQLTKIKAAEPDVLLMMCDYTEGGLILRQAKVAGLDNVRKIACCAMQSEQMIELAGADAAEGCVILVYWNPLSTAPKAKAYAEKFQAEFGALPDEREAYGYEVPYIIKQAIEAGATKETLADVLHTIEYDGVTGITKFDENGDVKDKIGGILMVKDGEFVEWDRK